MAFGSISKQRVEVGRTREFTLHALSILGAAPVLVVEHLGESNTQYWNDSIARANAEGAVNGRRRRVQLSAAKIREIRERNREIVAKYSVRATRGFFHDYADRPGVPDPKRPATSADIADIVRALPDDVFDELFEFVQEPGNFRDQEIIGDPKTLAGE
jgi:hypothetical protein